MIAYPVGQSGQTLALTDRVLAHFDRYRQRTLAHTEAGGQLFAKIAGPSIVVERATGPRPSDQRSALAFIPDRPAERHEIRLFFKAGLHFVGDWHTHREAEPQPSATDVQSFKEMFQQSRHQLAGFVLIIVGTRPPSEGLFVGVGNDTHLLRVQSGRL